MMTHLFSIRIIERWIKSKHKDVEGVRMFKKGDVVVAKDEFLGKGETLQDSAGVVVDYYPDNDYLLLGTLHPERFAIPPVSSVCGEFYRHITEQEKQGWNII